MKRMVVGCGDRSPRGVLFRVFAQRPSQCSWLPTVVVAVASALACEPALDVGSWKCVSAPLFVPPDGSPILPGKDTTVAPSWTTSFEDGFCGYAEARGYCYTGEDASYSIVDAPARSGRRAAAFTITADTASTDAQTRCVREGFLPQEAYYGAWFYIPERVSSNGNWNLMHFQGADDENPELRGLWDVSIQTMDDGRMLPRMFKRFGREPQATQTDVELPVAEWFQLQIRLKRDATEAGVAALYFNRQDSDRQLVAELSNVITDDTTWGQWYLGNLADNLSPAESTIYVDDVTIQPSLGADN